MPSAHEPEPPGDTLLDRLDPPDPPQSPGAMPTRLAAEADTLAGLEAELAAPDARRHHVMAVGGFLAVAAAVWIVVWWSHLHPPAVVPVQPPPPDLSGVPEAFRGWVHWDATWYESISRAGYRYQPGSPSAVAFFPGYPFAIRMGSRLAGANGFVVGSLLTLLAGAASIGLLWTWCRSRLVPAGAAVTVGLLALYPYSIYLYGPVYADALFLAGTLAAFVLLERDQVLAATVVAAATSATRPLGLVIAISVALRLIELRRTEARAAGGSAVAGRTRLGRLLPLPRRDLVIVGSGAGFLGYSAYLWWRFGDPLAFASVQGAPGWDQAPGPHTWFKVAFFDELTKNPTGPAALGLLLQLLFAGIALASVPAVRRRFGWAYAALVTGIVLFAAVGTKDFHGTGRYLLPAFPVMALFGERLATFRRARVLALGAGLPALLLFASWFAKGNYLA